MKYEIRFLTALPALPFCLCSAFSQVNLPQSQEQMHNHGSIMTNGHTCETAIPISCDLAIFGDITGVPNDTQTAGPTTCLPNHGGQIWFRYSSAINTPVTISACGQTDFNMDIKVFSGQCGELTCVLSPGQCQGAEVFFYAHANVPYLIRVGGNGGDEGSFALLATCAPLYYLTSVPGCVDMYSEAYYQTVSQDPHCMNTAWDAICQNAFVNFGGTAIYCSDPNACNYTPGNCLEVFSNCNYGCYGCTDPHALNYNPSATLDDDSCEFEVSVCPLDLSGDGVVGYSDITTFFSMMNCTEKCLADFNHDGEVNNADFNLLLNFFGSYCN